ncbi:hypothetical protein [Conexibacter sp. SYSU D00693]|uniref:PGN_0703 family putative restriction endonuclease n=1 Tax=Conexibacter sp. SYSU D00693 TaxID=2812560 RepID=UPI00196AA961|nr:hypothetical protein [Conexibacter sp. SYSU D00693]
MADLATRARAALAQRLRELLPGDALHEDGGHARRLADALVPTLADDDVAWAHAARAKGELRPARGGTVQAHAAWSSTALVAGAFAPWRADPGALVLPGVPGPFTGLRLEERLHIPHGGGTPNLDVALDGPGGLAGIEAKLTEHLAPRRPRAWKPAYRRPAMAQALGGGWRALFEDLLEERWAPRHLDAGQLVRHALSLRGAGDLVLLHWEPANGDDHPEVLAHRDEVRRLLERVGDAAPRLHVRTWRELWAVWEPRAPQHVAALRARYDVRA